MVESNHSERFLKEILYTSAKTEITHDASVQLDHSDMNVYEIMQIIPCLSGD